MNDYVVLSTASNLCTITRNGVEVRTFTTTGWHEKLKIAREEFSTPAYDGNSLSCDSDAMVVANVDMREMKLHGDENMERWADFQLAQCPTPTPAPTLVPTDSPTIPQDPSSDPEPISRGYIIAPSILWGTVLGFQLYRF